MRKTCEDMIQRNARLHSGWLAYEAGAGRIAAGTTVSFLSRSPSPGGDLPLGTVVA